MIIYNIKIKIYLDYNGRGSNFNLWKFSKKRNNE